MPKVPGLLLDKREERKQRKKAKKERRKEGKKRKKERNEQTNKRTKRNRRGKKRKRKNEKLSNGAATERNVFRRTKTASAKPPNVVADGIMNAGGVSIRVAGGVVS